MAPDCVRHLPRLAGATSDDYAASMRSRGAEPGLFALLIAGAAVAQSAEEIDDAISRLGGAREDARSIEFLIDAGEPAVAPLVQALKGVSVDAGHPRFARMLRALRAIGPRVSEACPMEVRARIDRLAPGAWRNPPMESTVVFDIGGGARPGADWINLQKLGGLDVVSLRLIRRAELIAAEPQRSEPVRPAEDADVFELEFAADLVDGQDRRALPWLLDLLDDADHPATVAVALGPTAIEVNVSKETAKTIVESAASAAVARIDPDHPEAVRGLARMVEAADDPRERVGAAAALGRHGQLASEHVPALLHALDSDDDRLVAEAVTALGMIGVGSKPVVARLRVLSEDSRSAIAARAKAALRALEKRNR